jgi:hypothetical protein
MFFPPGIKDTSSGQLTNMVSAAEPAHTNDERVLGPDEKKSMPFVFFQLSVVAMNDISNVFAPFVFRY